ncbi:branched-chain amino acid ABC transporter permease [Lentibacter algarum]|uniref:branched-chain amino acid ABC transporter permease n=1 Tax=Lentibacter algarum TaxID=576131 RepID=UPI001C07287F|nr:branched-chain amino acid ABC transporter permease [Lentibacter algarum]MBU2981848.1 branched-chain amino acid ABC transporter permease [Lentibacter algarum]
MIWIETLINGLLLGGLYALFGLGLSLIFGVMKIANIAHGEMAIGGAFLAIATANFIGLPLVLTVPIILLMAWGFGFALQMAVINRVLGSDPMPPLLMTFGLSIVVQNLLVEMFGADNRSLDIGALGTASIQIGNTSLGVFPLLMFAIALALFGALHWSLHHTRWGRNLRATSDDPEIVGMMGIDRRRVFAMVMGLSAALAALSGMMLAMRGSITPFSGGERLLIAFEVIVIGGLGSIWGSLIGGLVLGIVHVIGLRLDPASGPLYGHLLLLVILLAKPEGLAGKARSR